MSRRFPHLRIKNRVQSIDDGREELIAQGPNGPIWTTAGERRMTGDDKSELSHNLKAHAHMAAVQQAVQQVFEASAIFAESTIRDLAALHARNDDPDARRAHLSLNGELDDNGAAFLDWGKRFSFRQEGLTGILLDKGSEVARFTAKIDGRLVPDVLAQIRLIQMGVD